MSIKKSGFLVFLISLVVSLFVLGSIFMLFMVYSKGAQTEVPKTDIPYISEYQPKAEESMAVLMLGTKTPESLPDVSILFYYDAPQGIIYTISIPPETICDVNGRWDTIKGHYDYEGIRGSVNAVKSLLGVDIERYMRVQSSGISNLVDYLGGIEYKIEEDIKIDNQTFLEGEQLLDGRRVTSLIFNLDEDGIADYELHGDLFYKLIQDRFKPDLETKLKSFIGVIFYNTETNINQYDFALRQKGFSNKLKLDSLVTRVINLKGKYTKDKFTPDYEHIKEIQDTVFGLKE